jgi:hypothetical protein
MLDRAIAEVLLWGLRGALALFVAYEYTSYIEQKFGAVTRALSSLGAMRGM